MLKIAPMLLAVALYSLSVNSTVYSADNEPPTGFRVLFNGNDLTGWHGMPHFDPRALAALTETERETKRTADTEDAFTHWKVEAGELINDGHGTFLTTNETFEDYELLIDYRTVALADSGIYLKANPQVQIWDSTEEAKFGIGANLGSGGLWNNPAGAPGKDPIALADKPFGEWNSFRILQVGGRTTVYLNDKLIVDHAPMFNFWLLNDPQFQADWWQQRHNKAAPMFRKGPIQLQTHGGEIRWKNIFIRTLDSLEANAILANKGQAEGDQSLFDGKTLTGWTGAVENYEVIDGVIRCKPDHGGVLHTTGDYRNFVARLEFRLPPGGNNGLAIRYPGHGNAAYDGMTELQVLDNEAPQYNALDERQYHGSAYGLAPAHRGYARPTGEWNYQEVTVIGSTIKVELNGYVILDTDLATVTQYMADSPHPGKELASGAFGFAGHSDPVEFRNISIRPLTD